MRNTVIDIYKQLGDLISFELADTKREEFVALHTPKELRFMSLLKCFKKDIIINHIVEDIKKADIFYIENWSLFLDLKIIVQTVINALKGEAKAY